MRYTVLEGGKKSGPDKRELRNGRLRFTVYKLAEALRTARECDTDNILPDGVVSAIDKLQEELKRYV